MFFTKPPLQILNLSPCFNKQSWAKTMVFQISIATFHNRILISAPFEHFWFLAHAQFYMRGNACLVLSAHHLCVAATLFQAFFIWLIKRDMKKYDGITINNSPFMRVIWQSGGRMHKHENIIHELRVELWYRDAAGGCHMKQKTSCSTLEQR